MDLFNPATRAWFEAAFAAPTPAQAEGWPAIASGAHTLIQAPTGSGKTLAAFLWTLDRLLHEDLPARQQRCRVLYISPMKALAYDIDRNLRAPLIGIRHAAARLDQPELPVLETFLRTGDTPTDERRRMQRTPPDILITTPESFYMMLTSRAREVLASVRWVIVDEIHAVAGTKRGSHLAVSLERIEELCEESPQRIGLSATQRPLEAIAHFLGGGGVGESGEWTPRGVTIVHPSLDRHLELELIVPVEDMAYPIRTDPLAPEGVSSRSIWPAAYPRILDLIESHSSTIVFANSRRLAERICAELNHLAGGEIAKAHHGSVAREQRILIEEALKRGELKAVVATSSLELGIDMGAVDLVIQVEAPPSVASGLQRVGRAGHHAGGTAKAKILPKYRGDLLAATVIADRMMTGAIEATRIPRNPLDVLSQQLVAEVAIAERDADFLYDLVRRAAPFSDLSRSLFDATLDMLAGRYPSDLFSELRPRVNWDRVTGTVSARPGARQLAIANAGTIPDRGLYRVVLPDGTRVGELDEEMVYESREGDVFVLGASTWRIVDIGVDRVEVLPAAGEVTPRLPFWHGDALGRPIESGQAMGSFIREICALDAEAARVKLVEQHRLDPLAARNLLSYLEEQREATTALPTDETLVVERFRDEIGDPRLVLLSPLGAKVHAPWAMAVTQALRRTYGHDVDVIWSDDGMAFRFPDSDEIPGAEHLLIDPEEIEGLLIDHLADTALFASRFREAAGRALLLPRRRPGQRTPLWLQRRKAADLLKVAKGFDSFPIVLEAYREVLSDDFDLGGLQDILGGLRSRRIRLVEVETHSPSPFATSLLFSFVASFLYEGDAPLAERRAAALTLDRRLLSELLGESDLRELISEDAISDLEAELQHLRSDRRVAGPDLTVDLLRDLGPLTVTDVAARSLDEAPAEVLARLETEGRAIRVRLGGEERWAAIEDAGRLRDALGIQPPPGLPYVFIEPVADALGDVVGRFARTHGPFAARDAGLALGIGVQVVSETLSRLEAEGRVVRGGLRPDRGDVEWIDRGVLQRLKRRTLASLRSEIEPVPARQYAAFLPAWQGIGPHPPAGEAALVTALRGLQGVDLPASVLEPEILGVRTRDPSQQLDRLMLAGQVVWTGRGSIGDRDGRISLYFRDSFSRLWTPLAIEPRNRDTHEAIRRHLQREGASFFFDIYAACRGGDPTEVAEALWDLVWAGEVTNDTLEPLRAFLRRRGGSRRAQGRALRSSFPPETAGRWSLVSNLLRESSPTEHAATWAELLANRCGVVTRAAVAAEGLPGGFTALYPVLSRMEEMGKMRRGYFVEGFGGAQFALPGAVDRLRIPVAGETIMLAATDPANAYGLVLDWPSSTRGRLARKPGAHVVLRAGELAAFVDGSRMVAFDEAPSPDLSAALAGGARRLGRLSIRTVNGQPAEATPWGTSLREAGFAPTARGLRFIGHT